MKNREKYAKKNFDIACEGKMIALKNGDLCACNDIRCAECDIYDDCANTDCAEKLKEWCEAEYVEKPKISESDRRCLDDLEQDEKENGWIPAEERLPDERDWYLAVFRESDTDYQLIPRVADFMNTPEKENATSDGWGIIDLEKPKEYIKLLKCVAWMPLPEPYKED